MKPSPARDDGLVVEDLPEVELPTGRSVAGPVLRVVLAGALVVLMTLAYVRAAGGGDITKAGTMGTGTAIGFGVVTAALAVTLHRIPVAHVAVGAAAIGVLLSGHGPFDPMVLAMLPFAHVALRATGWCTVVPWGARIEVAALRDDARTSLAVQAGAQVLGVVALLAAGHHAVWMLGVAAAALVALTYLAIPRVWWR